MVTKATAGSSPKKSAAPKAANNEAPIKVTNDGRLAVNEAPAADRSKANDGKAGPKSSLETGVGSPTGASAGGEGNFEGRRADGSEAKGMDYDVQAHSDEDVGGLKRGLQVVRVRAESGDEAALKVREAHKANYGLSIRGVTPASDPDPNSLGGERDASIMLANAKNGGDAGINPRGTEANAKAVEKLGKADIEDLGE